MSIYYRKKEERWGRYYYGRTKKVESITALFIHNRICYTLIFFFLTCGFFALTGGYGNFNGGVDFLTANSFDENNFTQSRIIFNNLRFSTSTINYSITDCSVGWVRHIEQAYATLSNLTVLKFIETNQSDDQISIGCTEPSRIDKFLIAEGGADQIIIHRRYIELHHGILRLLRYSECPEETVIHETFHALGFGHNANPKSIMYPYQSCNSTINNYLIKEINQVYSDVGK